MKYILLVKMVYPSGKYELQGKILTWRTGKTSTWSCNQKVMYIAVLNKNILQGETICNDNIY